MKYVYESLYTTCKQHANTYFRMVSFVFVQWLLLLLLRTLLQLLYFMKETNKNKNEQLSAKIIPVQKHLIPYIKSVQQHTQNISILVVRLVGRQRAKSVTKRYNDDDDDDDDDDGDDKKGMSTPKLPLPFYFTFISDIHQPKLLAKICKFHA